MAPLSWRIPARVSVSGPTGWLPMERVDVVRVDGAAQVSVETWPVAETDIEQVCADHAASLVATRTGWTDAGVEPATVIGSTDGRRRTCGWLADGVAVNATMHYRLDPGTMFVTTIAITGADPIVAAEADAIAASIAVGFALDFGSQQLESSPRTSGTAADWAPARDAWSRDESAAAETSQASITFEEGLAAARQHGARDFPGVDVAFLAAFDQAQAAVALRVASRSIEARAATEPRLAAQLALAAAHDLLVLRETTNASATTAAWFAARPDAAVVLGPDATSGQVSIADVRADDVVARLLGATDPVSDPRTHDRLVATPTQLDALVRGVLDRSEHPELDALADDLRGRTTVRTVFRNGGALGGGEVEWLDAGSAGRWQIMRDANAPDTVTLQAIGTSGLRLALLAVLPGDPSPEMAAPTKEMIGR